MNEFYAQGTHTRQAHKGIPEGMYEEEQGLSGFFGPVSHLIKKQPSTRWQIIEGDLRPHMLDLVRFEGANSVWPLLHNNQAAISWRHVAKQSAGNLKAERNADGDVLYFCHSGSGLLFSEYGALEFRKGHYIIVPKCLTHTFATHEATQLLVVESFTSHYAQPDRGLVGRHAIYDPQALVKPNLDLLHAQLKSWGQVQEVSIKHSGKTTRYGYENCVYSDIVGWKGDLYPYTLHVDHMMPLMSHRAHLPPSAHTTFVARDFVVCTFLPRPLEHDADALKVPFYHQNIDYDEVLFYHEGDFFSRDNLHAGMMSFHPAGFPHGPHPKAVKNIEKKTATNEYAVMIDTRWPLQMTSAAEQVELKEYWRSWQK